MISAFTAVIVIYSKLDFCDFRSVAFWDIRNVKNMKSKLSSLHRTRVATSAYFSPQTGSQVLVTSLDDYVT